MQLLKNLIYGLKILNTEGLHTVRMYIVHIVENPCSSKTCIKFCWFFLRKLWQKTRQIWICEKTGSIRIPKLSKKAQ